MPGPPKRTEPTPAQRTMIDRYRAGESADAIAISLGVARRSVYNALALGGIERKRTMHSLTSEQEEAVARRYAAGESVRQIAMAFPHVHLVTVHNALKRRGTATRPDLAKHSVPAEDEAAVVAACVAGAHVRDGARIADVARDHGVSGKTVTRILQRHDVELPTGRPRLHTLNESAFDDVTDRAAAYWTGFLFADGCIDGDVLTLGLAECDRAHVEKFRDFLGSSHAIVHHEARDKTLKSGRVIHGGPWVSVGVSSRRLVEALRARGMVPIKSERFPSPALEDSADFWRGAVDGDGSIRLMNCRGYIYADIWLGGTLRLMESFRDFMKRAVGANLSVCEGSDVRVVNTSASTARNAIALLYGDDGVALERKLLRAKVILNLH